VSYTARSSFKLLIVLLIKHIFIVRTECMLHFVTVYILNEDSFIIYNHLFKQKTNFH